MKYPDRPTEAKSQEPRAGVSAAIFLGDAVLLVQRAKAPFAGLWSLPGGGIAWGEEARAAALREVREETGLAVEILGVADVHDVFVKGADGLVVAHFVLPVFYGRAGAGTPTPGDDARAACFVPLGCLQDYALTEGAEPIIRRAANLLRTCS